MSASRAALVAAAVACACPLLAHAGDSFPDAQSAAVAALGVAMPKSDRACVEYAGAVLRSAAGYTFTGPERSGREFFILHIRLHRGESIAALYHTHPDCGDGSGVSTEFSPTDKQTARDLRVPSYIGCLLDGSIRRFDPARSSVISLQK